MEIQRKFQGELAKVKTKNDCCDNSPDAENYVSLTRTALFAFIPITSIFDATRAASLFKESG